MRWIQATLVAGIALSLTSCMVWVENPVGPVVVNPPEDYVIIESDTRWEGEIDGVPISGYGDRIFYTDADCVILEKRSCCGFIEVTVYHGWCEPQTSYTDANYGVIWICG